MDGQDEPPLGLKERKPGGADRRERDTFTLFTLQHSTKGHTGGLVVNKASVFKSTNKTVYPKITVHISEMEKLENSFQFSTPIMRANNNLIRV